MREMLCDLPMQSIAISSHEIEDRATALFLKDTCRCSSISEVKDRNTAAAVDTHKKPRDLQ